MSTTQKLVARIALRFFSFSTLFTIYFVVTKGALMPQDLKTVILSGLAMVVSAELFTWIRVRSSKGATQQ